MQFVWIGVGFLTVAALVVVGIVWGSLRLGRRRPARGFWIWSTFAVLASIPFSALILVPAALGFIGSRWVGTRGDEAAWAGPRVVDGRWIVQTKASLRSDREAAGDGPAVADPAAEEAVQLTSADGTLLRAFWVPAPGAARARAVLVHGLFRGGLELEPVGAMFHELGCDVLILELRNHGQSGRAPATFGLREADDVLAAAQWVRAKPGAARDKIVLFGVSLGTAAVSLAAPRVEGLAAIVLDAPMDDALSTAHRMLGVAPKPGRRGVRIGQPFRSLVLGAVELWSGFALDDVRPSDRLLALPPTVAVLLIGGSEDQRMPPWVVRTVFDRLPTDAGRKKLWIRDGSEHGKVWLDAPDDYRARLAALLESL